MEPRLNFYKAGPDAMKAMAGLEQQIVRSSLERSLIELVRLRESERRLATVAVWRDTPFFTSRERAALQWTESVTLVAESHVPDDSWEQVQTQFAPAELVDLTLLIGTINMWNRFAIAFRKHPV